MIERSITIDNRKIRYLEAGKGPSLLLLHSWPYCADIFYKNIDSLGKKYHVIAPDFPGFGHSERDKNSNPTMEDLANFIVKLTECLDLGKVNIVGVSMGGTIALLVAAKYPKIVTRAVVHSPIYNSDWFWNNSKLSLSGVRLFRWLFVFPMGKQFLLWYIRSRLRYWMRIIRLDKKIILEDGVKIRQIYSVIRASSSGAIISIFDELVTRDHADYFRGIDCPVLVIQGDNDLLPKSAMEYLCTEVLKYGNLKLVKNGTHDLVVERSDDFNKLVNDFI